MLQSCFESSINELLLRYKKREWLLELESTPGKDDAKIAEMTTNWCLAQSLNAICILCFSFYSNLKIVFNNLY